MRPDFLPVAMRSICLFLFDFGLKSILCVVLACVIVFSMKSASAAARHLVWRTALCGVLCLPLLTPVLPAMRSAPALRLPTAKQIAPNPQNATHALSPPSLSLEGESHRAEPPDAAESISSTQQVPIQRAIPSRFASWQVCIAALWLAGAALLLARIAIALMLARRLQRHYRRVEEGPLKDAAQRAAAVLGKVSSFALYIGLDSTVPGTPITLGHLKPVILLPAGAVDWPPDRLQSILRHEIAHIKRADWLTQMAANMVCALGWFNPLLWLAARRLRMESDYACDDAALNSGISALDYAQHLLAVARTLQRRRSNPILVTMAHQPEIRMRMQFILSNRNNRNSISRFCRWGAYMAALGVLLPLSAWKTIAWAAEPDGTARTTVKEPIVASQWRATLPGGAHAQLERVQMVGGDGTVRQWRPDGTELKDGWIGSLAHKGQCEISARLTFPDRKEGQRAAVDIKIPGGVESVGNLAGAWVDGKQQNYFMAGIVQAFPPAQATTDMVLRIAYVPRRIIITTPPVHTTTRRLPANESITLTRLVPGKAYMHGHLSPVYQVRITAPSRLISDCDFWLSYLDKSGKERNFPHASCSMPEVSGTQATVRFTVWPSEVPAGRVKRLVFRSRPFQTVVFKNIALHPARDGGAPGRS